MINKKFLEKKEEIIYFFSNCKFDVFTKNILHAILLENGTKWDAGINLGIKDFLLFLNKKCHL